MMIILNNRLPIFFILALVLLLINSLNVFANVVNEIDEAKNKSYKLSSAIANQLIVNSSALNSNGDRKEELKHSIINNFHSKGEQYINNNLRKYHIEIDLGYSSEEQQYEPSILTVQPLFQSKDKVNTLFTQIRAAGDYITDSKSNANNKNSFEITSNIGLGYRRLLLDKKLLLGVNSFYDRNWKWEHNRFGYGFEAKLANFDFYTNYYDSVSGEKTRGNLTQKALSGYDIEFVGQLPYLPWAQISYKRYIWESELINDDIKGNVFTAILTPTQRIRLEVAYNKGKQKDFDVVDSTSILLRYTLPFGGSVNYPKHKLIDNHILRMRDMSDHTLDIIRRENDIVVEETDNSSIKVVRLD